MKNNNKLVEKIARPAFCLMTRLIAGPVMAAEAAQSDLQGPKAGSGIALARSPQAEREVRQSKQVNRMDAVTTLDALTVNGQAGSGYAVSGSNAATKTETPVIETPVSLQVVPRAVMDDQNTTRVKEALENISGVRPQPTLGSGFIIRGFRNNRIYRNGLLSNGTGFPSESDAGSLETIEVLKGPAAVLFGRTEPGGIVHITTKKPLDSAFYSLEQQFGSYDFYRTQWDATGPVTEGDALLYRFTGSYQNNDSFRDFIATDRVMVYPSLTWRPTEATDINISVEGVDQDYQADFGIPVIGDRSAPIPVGRSLDDSNNPMDHLSKVQMGTELNHRFNDGWAIHSRFLAVWGDDRSTFVNPVPAFGEALHADQRMMDRNIFSQDSTTELYTTNLDLTGQFQLGPTRHETLVGFDYFQSFDMYHTSGEWNDPNPALAIDIFNPRYGIAPAVYDNALSSVPSLQVGSNFAVFDNQWYGVYFQDHITLWDKLHIMGGGRYDWAETGSSYKGSFDAAEASLLRRKDEGFSPRVGILYQPIDEMGIYGNWTTSFGANNGLSSGGATFDPEIGEQFEAGIKAQLFDERLLAMLAYYHLTKTNLLTSDLSTPDPFDKAAIGEARSQGIELDVTGQITDNISLIGSYAFTDARITKNNDGAQGNRLNNVPEHAGSLWVKYEFKDVEAVDGGSMGLGGIAAGQREGDVVNSFQLPGFVRLDAMAAYKWTLGESRVTAQVNIRNLLDKQYYESTDPDANVSSRLGVYPGAPLMAFGSVRVEY